MVAGKGDLTGYGKAEAKVGQLCERQKALKCEPDAGDCWAEVPDEEGNEQQGGATAAGLLKPSGRGSGASRVSVSVSSNRLEHWAMLGVLVARI